MNVAITAPAFFNYLSMESVLDWGLGDDFRFGFSRSRIAFALVGERDFRHMTLRTVVGSERNGEEGFASLLATLERDATGASPVPAVSLRADGHATVDFAVVRFLNGDTAVRVVLLVTEVVVEYFVLHLLFLLFCPFIYKQHSVGFLPTLLI